MIRTIGILTIWLSSVVGGFWFFGAKFFIPVEKPAGSANPTEIVGKIIQQSNQITVYNFWNPTCPCSRFMEDHVKSVIREYEPKGVRFIHIVEGTEKITPSIRSKWSGELQLDASGAIARKFGVWAAPAAVVVDGSGKVQFVGSYNVSRYCDDEKTAYAEQAIAKLLANQKVDIATVPFYGCSNLGA